MTHYETGATSHAINDLILFTDNTVELAKLRDAIYTDHANANNERISTLELRFNALVKAAKMRYIVEFPNSHGHIESITTDQEIEFCKIFAEDFNIWKSEQSL